MPEEWIAAEAKRQGLPIESLPMPSARIHEGKYLVLGTSRECVVERCENGRWVLDVDGEFHENFDTKREALVYCQDHPEL